MAFSVPFVISSMMSGAIMGAATSAISYTGSIAFSRGGFKNWDNNEFLKAIGKGALNGAISGGIGNLFSQVGINLIGTSTGLWGGTKSLLLQSSSTTVTSILSNLATGQDWNSYISIGVGAFNIPLRNGKLSKEYGDYLNNAYVFGIHLLALADVALGYSTIKFDASSFRFVFQPKDYKGIIDNTILRKGYLGTRKGGAIFIGAEKQFTITPTERPPRYPIENKEYPGFVQKYYAQYADYYAGSLGTLWHEGTHAIQSGFMGELQWSLAWRITLLSKKSYYMNCQFENVARERAYELTLKYY